MRLMKLQEEFSNNFNNHEVVVNESFAHVQQNGVLKVQFQYQMAEMLKEIKRIKKIHSQRRVRRIRLRILLPPLHEKREVVVERPETGVLQLRRIA